MKNKKPRALTSIVFILAFASPLLSFDEPAKNQKATPTAENAPAFKSQEEKQSYALGMNVGSQLRNWSLELDPNLFMQGLKDVLSGGKTLLTEQEVRATVRELQAELRKKQIALRRKASIGTTQKQPENNADPAAAAVLKDVRISFKLDPRLSGPTYGGERWISPPTYSSGLQGGKEATVEAKLQGVGANGMPVDVSAEWTPADPEMVTVTPGERNQVKITVHRAGESKLTVVSNGVSKALLIKATYLGNATQVQITPQSVAQD